MKKKERYAVVPLYMFEHAIAGGLTYQEICALIYMLTFCGMSDGKRNPYKRGRTGIMEVFNLSNSRAKRILSSLKAKGFVKSIYRVRKRDGEIIETASLKYARSIKFTNSGQQLKTFYSVRRTAKLTKRKPKTQT